MSTKTCAGCFNALKIKDSLKCSKCHKNYDTLCANINDGHSRALSTEQKNAWKCPDCMNKIPKGNNTNTPLRPPQSDITLSHNTSSPSCTNVTLRNKRCTNSTQALSSDENIFEISRADLKELIRHEIKNAVHEALADQLKGMNDLLSSFQ
ncbi:unnamed protein product, partial [Brenthis ino]